jgi:hypothetical protein
MSYSNQFKFMKSFLDLYWTIQNFITDNSLIGIPLDIFAHFFASMFLSLGLLKIKFSIKRAFVVIFVIAFIKECIDWKYNTRHTGEERFYESLKDIFVTMIYPSILMYIRSKNKVES